MKSVSGYYALLLKTTLKQISLWIVIGVYQLYFVLVLIILPLARDASPIEVWNFSIQNAMSSLPVSINIHLLLFILSGLFCVFLAVLLFKKDIDDGSRLVTSTKPLSRPAMFCCKFGTYVSVCILTAIISLVITAFSMFLPKGFDDIKTFDSIYTSIIVADIVMFFVFGSVSIFLAQLISSVGMMSSVVGGAVMLSVIDILAPVIVDSNQTIIEEKTGAVADSYKYFQYDGTINTLANLDNSSYNLKTEWNKINKFSPTKVTGAFDVANQLVTTLNMFKMEENNNDHIKRNALGASQHYQYKISSESIIKELNDFSTTIPALIPMHFGVGASMQSKFGTVGYSFNESSYDEITSMMNIEPIGYYISCTTGKLTFVYWEDLQRFAQPIEAENIIHSLTDQLINNHENFRETLELNMQQFKNIYGNEFGEDYYNITSMKIFLEATRYIEQRFWTPGTGIFPQIFFNYQKEDGEYYNVNDLSEEVLNTLYEDGTNMLTGNEVDFNLLTQYRLYSNLYKDVFFSMPSWEGWNGTETSDSSICMLPTVDFGGMDVIKQTYAYTSAPIIPSTRIIPIWLSISVAILILSAAVFNRKDIF